MNTPDDDFDRRMRDILHSRALSISPDADALTRIHAGARRRQLRQRITVSGGAALAVVAVAVAGITLRPTQQSGTQLAGSASSTSPAPTVGTTPATLGVTRSPVPTSATTPPSSAAIGVIPSGGAPPKGFVPLSVTAVSASTYWVLGHAPCGVNVCAAVAKTTDGGKSFTEVSAPASRIGPAVPGTTDVLGSSVVSQIRFGDGNDGWAFGGGLWQTADGGITWSPSTIDASAPQSAVQRLAAANHRAWAVVLTDATAATGPTYEVYSTTYPGGSWQKVKSAGVFGPGEPMLAVEGATAVVIGTDAVTGDQRGLTAKGGSDIPSFTPFPVDLPCAYSPGDPLSATTDALWLACVSATGGVTGAYVSPDFGPSWHPATAKLAGPTAAIGAVNAKSAITVDGGKLMRVSSDGSTASVSQPKVDASTTFAFIGFTTTSDGFAIPIVDGSRQLWRTTDGGAHWSVVAF